MKHILALPALLRSASLLAAAAAPRSFSVNDDVLAFPQYDIHFSEDWTSEHDAERRLRNSGKRRGDHGVGDDQPTTNDASSQIGQYRPPPSFDESATGSAQSGTEFEYEYMVMEGQRWLCALPRLSTGEKPATSNSTLSLNATQASLDEEMELSRAAHHGWELLDGMQGNCIYYNTGWWSYRFCYNEGVKQFHQLPPSGSVPRYPPQEDPSVVGFVLGSYPKKQSQDREGRKSAQAVIEAPEDGAVDKSVGSSVKVYSQPGYGELVQQGDSRYLVKRLGGGTTCDLTGKERRIEVQVSQSLCSATAQKCCLSNIICRNSSTATRKARIAFPLSRRSAHVRI
jgi:protein OS-9